MKVVITESKINNLIKEYLMNSYDISFNNSEEYVFTMPPLYNMKNWFLMIGVDVDESFTEAEKLRTFYLDKLEVKFKKIINDYLND